MGDFSVKAVLSAVDKNFTSTMKSAMGYTSDLKRTLTSGIGFGAMMAVGQKAVSVVGNGITGLVGDMNSASAAWKTFEGNLSMNGKAVSDIRAIKGELQDFATQTIYSASDMASTYAQLEAVGTKNTTKLVKGFGGLAAAAESPAQAMKTLSQQATQMAAKPTVAWEDFKLMLEQTPAGMAAVAKEMGMATTDMIKKIQSGTLATEDFFDAIAKVGTNDAFTKLATEYKTADQAMDGLQETVSVKLGPSFEVMSDIGIRAVSKLIDAMDGIDGTALATKLSSTLDKANGYWQVFKENVVEVKNAFGDAISAIGVEMGKLNGAFGSTESISAFSSVIEMASGALVAFAGFLERHAEVIAQVLPWIPKLLIAYQGFRILRTIAPFVGAFTCAIGGLAKLGLSKLTPNLFKVARGQEEVGKSSGASSKKILASSKAFMMLGAGVALISGGFYLLAQSAVAVANAEPLAVGVLAGLVLTVTALSVGMIKMLSSMSGGTKKLAMMSTAMIALGASILLVSTGFALLTHSAISLANAGPLAIGVMVGMVAAIALLAAGAALLGPMLTAGAVGFIAFGAAIVLVSTGALLASAALAVVASVLPVVVQYGLSGAVAITALGASMVVFAAGAAAAGVGCVALGAGLVIVGAGLTLVGAAVLVTAAGVLVLAAGAVTLGAGLTLCAASLTAAGVALPLVASGAATSAASFALLLASATALSVLMVALSASMVAMGVASTASAVGVAAFALAMATGAAGSLAMAAALKAVNSSMKSIASNARSAESSLDSMRSSVDVVGSGLDAIGSKARSAMNSLMNAFDNASNKATSSGQAVGRNFNTGLSTGMVSAVATARSTSSSVVSALGSASSGAYSAGVNIGAGLANGMRSMVGAAWSAAAELAAAAEAAIRAKAQIHSPSRVSGRLAKYFGQGWVDNLKAMTREAWKAAENLVRIPEAPRFDDMRLAYAGGPADLNGEYDYNSNIYVQVESHLDVDGREVAKATAPYTKEEISKIESRENRKHGRR